MNDTPNTTQLKCPRCNGSSYVIAVEDGMPGGAECPLCVGDGAPRNDAERAFVAALTTQPAMELPALPDPAFTYERSPGRFHEPVRVGAYAAEQMRAYGEACRAYASSAALGEKPAGFLWRSKGSSEPWKFCRDASQADDPDVFERTDIRFVYEGPRPTPPSAQQEGGA